MRFIIISIILLLLHLTINGQTIRGIVLDKESRTPIDYAIIYLNGTSVGTNSDRNGKFELDISKHTTLPLTVSALGYYSSTFNDMISGNELKVYLVRKLIELDEVYISASGNPRKRKENMRLFRTAFLGTDFNARKSTIVNEDKIRVYLSSDNDTLKAFSLEPIIIDNSALGYKISYYLDGFILCKKDNYLLYIGSVFFNDYKNISEKSKMLSYEKRRKEAYFGSKMQFFRSLWNNSLDSSGFIINDNSNSKLNYEQLVFQQDTFKTGKSTKYLKHGGILNITYLPQKKKSDLLTLYEYTEFNKDGFFNSLALQWGGEMAKERIVDWLPYDYIPE
jgi:hypothetical protein